MQFNVETLSHGRARRYRLVSGDAPVSFAAVLALLRTDPRFSDSFNSLLAEAPFEAFRWETPPVTATTVQRDFEFVLLDAPGLDRPPDSASFAPQLQRLADGNRVAAFPNLGNDAFLIVPRPLAATSAYGHLAAFVRNAPEPQRYDLWQAVGAAMEARLGDQPVWLSTAGMGVPWLHVRLDSRPKYYGYEPYTRTD
ncbi:MAG: DUF6940 family protein [Actinomycetota bacterium]